MKLCGSSYAAPASDPLPGSGLDRTGGERANALYDSVVTRERRRVFRAQRLRVYP